MIEQKEIAALSLEKQWVSKSGNNLFPVFLKLEDLNVLIVGGSDVGLEKLLTILHNSPGTKITLVSITVNDAILHLARQHYNIDIIQRSYKITDLAEAQLVFVALKDSGLGKQIYEDARQNGCLVNVAGQPALCDFYLSSIVKKGNLKIAISTNGRSLSIATRLKEIIDRLIPDEVESALQNITTQRPGITDDTLDKKLYRLNDLSKLVVAKQISLEETGKPEQKQWQNIVKWCLLAFMFMILGYAVFSLLPHVDVVNLGKEIRGRVDVPMFLTMLLTGFIAQMVDGSLGMGYGTISTTFLLATGVNPAIVSSRVHSARVFSSGVSGYSHHRFGNINKKLFSALVIPGIIGAIIGASCAYIGQAYASYVKLPLSIYTLYLGYYIVRKAFKKQNTKDKIKKAGWLASLGGFMDAFAGGGWGTLVTSTLISKRKTPRYVIGSVCLAEFFVVLASSITFFIFLKSIPLADVAGLIIGGLIAAPIAARLVGKLPLRAMFISVGSVVILTSMNTLWKAIGAVLN